MKTQSRPLIAVSFLAALIQVLPATSLADTPKTAGEKKAYALYQQSLKGDALVNAGKYAEAARFYAELLQSFEKLDEEDESVQSFQLNVGASELLPLRGLRLGYAEIEAGGTAEIREDRFTELLAETAEQLIYATTGTEEYDDGQIADEAIRVIKLLASKVSDSEAYSAQMRLSVAVSKLENAIKRRSSLASKQINGTTGEAALKSGKERLKNLTEQAKKAAAAAAAAEPADAVQARQGFLEGLNKMEAQLNQNGFVADEDFTGWLVDPSGNLKTAATTMKSAYDKEGKTMSADATKPLADKAAALKSLAQSKAPSLTFPTGLVADKAIEASVKAQLTKNLPGTKVLKLGMEGKDWSVNRTALGLIESHVRYGYVLYQVKGETLPRCSRFSYQENYDGKKYLKADGARGYTETRWQSAK